MTVLALSLDLPAVDADRPLVDGMAGGDPAALRLLCERLGPSVLAYLVGQLGDRALAEDVAQEVMLAAWRGAGAFRGDSRVRTWLLAIAHHRAVTARSRASSGDVPSDPVALDRHAHSARGLDASDDRIDLRAAVRRLPPEHRAVLDLVFFHGLSVEEAAEVLCVAPGTVKSRLHRARAALRERLGADYDRGV